MHAVDGASCYSNCSVALPPQQRSFHRIHRVVQMCAPVTGTYVAKPSQICRQNGISIGSSVFAQLIREPTHSQTDRQTDRQTTLRHDVHRPSNSLHSHAGQCWRCGLIMTADVNGKYKTYRNAARRGQSDGALLPAQKIGTRLTCSDGDMLADKQANRRNAHRSTLLFYQGAG